MAKHDKRIIVPTHIGKLRVVYDSDSSSRALMFDNRRIRIFDRHGWLCEYGQLPLVAAKQVAVAIVQDMTRRGER